MDLFYSAWNALYHSPKSFHHKTKKCLHHKWNGGVGHSSQSRGCRVVDRVGGGSPATACCCLGPYIAVEGYCWRQ